MLVTQEFAKYTEEFFYCLDVSDNKLFTLPDCVTHLTALQTLDVSSNFISDINQQSLDAMTSLWRLQMHGNLLLNISSQVFTKKI